MSEFQSNTPTAVIEKLDLTITPESTKEQIAQKIAELVA